MNNNNFYDGILLTLERMAVTLKVMEETIVLLQHSVKGSAEPKNNKEREQ